MSAPALVGYVSTDEHAITDWHGVPFGRVTSARSHRRRGIGRTYAPHTVHTYRVVIDGEHYYGRNAGPSMLIRLRAAKGGRRVQQMGDL